MICFRVVMIVVLLGYIEHLSSMLARQHPDGIVITLQLWFIAYYSLHYYHDGVNVSMEPSYFLYIMMNQGDLGYRALSTVADDGVTFGHWVNQVARNLFVNMECFYVFINC
ncbi:hypothetical protein Hanom_Chr08g00723061 [Helianthus anomalus]